MSVAGSVWESRDNEYTIVLLWEDQHHWTALVLRDRARYWTPGSTITVVENDFVSILRRIA